MKTILIATKNPHKKNKLEGIVKDYFDKILFLDELNSAEIEESGKSFQENAEIKAKEYSYNYEGYVIATDGGIEIPALPSWNGLYTKRFAGEKASDFERINKLLELMKNKKGSERRMRWKEAIAIARQGKILFSLEVKGSEGVLQNSFDSKKYKEGIWVCSVWFFPQFNKNFFDLSVEERLKIESSWENLKQKTQFFLSTSL